MKRHYTYKVTLPETGEYYIGVRSTSKDISLDNYKGSMLSWKVDKTKLIKEVYREFDTREDAEEWESLAIETCIKDPLNKNAHIPGIGFSTYGLPKIPWNKNKKTGPNLKLKGRPSPLKGVKSGPNPKLSEVMKGKNKGRIPWNKGLKKDKNKGNPLF